MARKKKKRVDTMQTVKYIAIGIGALIFIIYFYLLITK